MAHEDVRGFLIIHPFMMHELGLSGVPLLLFARIYGFCATGARDFYESKSTTARFLNVNVRSVFRAMNELVDRGYVVEVGSFQTSNITSSKVYRLGAPALKIARLTDRSLAYGISSGHDETSCMLDAERDISSGAPMTKVHLIRKEDNKDFL